MKRLILLPALLLSLSSLMAQEDAEALSILNRFSDRAKSAPSVSMKFKMTTLDLRENHRDTLSGSLIIAGDKYRLMLPESTTWFNGSDNWNYMPSVSEVTITRPEQDDASFFSRPSLLFDAYKNDYRPRLIEESASAWVIDLYPAEPDNEMIRLRLTISKTGLILKSTEYRTRNGISIELDITSYDLKFKPDARFFDFNPANYSGLEIIDMR